VILTEPWLLVSKYAALPKVSFSSSGFVTEQTLLFANAGEIEGVSLIPIELSKVAVGVPTKYT
jgi:hypothetical protein